MILETLTAIAVTYLFVTILTAIYLLTPKTKAV
jgi:hypothetical protein